MCWVGKLNDASAALATRRLVEDDAKVGLLADMSVAAPAFHEHHRIMKEGW